MADENTTQYSAEELAASLRQTTSSAPYLVLITGSETGRMYKILRRETVIGRHEDSDVCIGDHSISRQHAKVVVQPDGTVEVVDLGSTNGTFWNGERIERHILRDGDKIQVGTTVIFKFSVQDVLDEHFQRTLYEHANRDVVTGCFNKRYLLERLPAELSFVCRKGGNLAFALLDVDHFKLVNDTHGHPAGDLVLRHVARMVQGAIRQEDILTRYGGDEFALILRATTATGAYLLGERVRKSLIEQPATVQGNKTIEVTASLGIAAPSKFEGIDAQALIGMADQQLYRAKHNGRNRVEPRPVDPAESR